MQLKGAERHYPVHKKELLAIVQALKKWCSDLLGLTFTVYTDIGPWRISIPRKIYCGGNCVGRN